MDTRSNLLLRYCVTFAVSALVFASPLGSAAEREKPVTHLAQQAYSMHTAQGDAIIPVEISVNLNSIHPEITRAAIVFHGKGRNVEGYFSALERAAHEAGQSAGQTLLWAPQLLREEDAEAHHLSKQFLRWHAGSWTSGEPASGPLPLSTFDVIDAMDRLPNFMPMPARHSTIGAMDPCMRLFTLQSPPRQLGNNMSWITPRKTSSTCWAPMTLIPLRLILIHRAPAKPRERNASIAVNPISTISRADIRKTLATSCGSCAASLTWAAAWWSLRAPLPQCFSTETVLIRQRA
jgi:hypothetical protein